MSRQSSWWFHVAGHSFIQPAALWLMMKADFGDQLKISAYCFNKPTFVRLSCTTELFSSLILTSQRKPRVIHLSCEKTVRLPSKTIPKSPPYRQHWIGGSEAVEQPGRNYIRNRLSFLTGQKIPTPPYNTPIEVAEEAQENERRGPEGDGLSEKFAPSFSVTDCRQGREWTTRGAIHIPGPSGRRRGREEGRKEAHPQRTGRVLLLELLQLRLESV